MFEVVSTSFNSIKNSFEAQFIQIVCVSVKKKNDDKNDYRLFATISLSDSYMSQIYNIGIYF